jgi:glycosyltransferase involved in cell wall biosynthesis
MLRALYRRLPKAGKTCVKGAWLWLRQIAWQIPYAVSYLCARLYRKRLASDALDVLFVMDRGDKDWILGAICRRIADASGRRVGYYCHENFYVSGENAGVNPLRGTGGATANHASNGNGILHSFRDPLWPLSPKLPDAKNYFFADAPFFAWCLKSFPPLWHRKTFAYFTHPRERFSDREMVFVLNQATHTISMSSADRRDLISKGVNPGRITAIVGGADPAKFEGHERSPQGLVGFCTACYPRKNPGRIDELVRRMPHRKFLLLGKHWERYDGFDQLKSLPNFEFVDAYYEMYPRYFRQMTVFVSVSFLEGGPIPLLEAMMSNVVPVASRTGFGEDVIRHGENGYLFDPYAPTDEVCELIEKAFLLKTDVRSTVLRHSWQEFAREVNRKFS